MTPYKLVDSLASQISQSYLTDEFYEYSKDYLASKRVGWKVKLNGSKYGRVILEALSQSGFVHAINRSFNTKEVCEIFNKQILFCDLKPNKQRVSLNGKNISLDGTSNSMQLFNLVSELVRLKYGVDIFLFETDKESHYLMIIPKRAKGDNLDSEVFSYLPIPSNSNKCKLSKKVKPTDFYVFRINENDYIDKLNYSNDVALLQQDLNPNNLKFNFLGFNTSNLSKSNISSSPILQIYRIIKEFEIYGRVEAVELYMYMEKILGRYLQNESLTALTLELFVKGEIVHLRDGNFSISSDCSETKIYSILIDTYLSKLSASEFIAEDYKYGLDFIEIEFTRFVNMISSNPDSYGDDISKYLQSLGASEEEQYETLKEIRYYVGSFVYLFGLE